MGNNEQNPADLANAAGNGNTLSGSSNEAVSGNNDLGGENFGVNDAGSWDEGSASASSGDGGGDWDT